MSHIHLFREHDMPITTPATRNATLRSDARSALRGHWLPSIGTFMLFYLLTEVAYGPGWVSLLQALLAGALLPGVCRYALARASGEAAAFSQLFDAFDNRIWLQNALLLQIARIALILLGLLCLVVPGIMLALGLSQAFYLLAQDPQLGPEAAMRRSWAMMRGHKWRLLRMWLFFLMLSALSVLTLGLALLLVLPWMEVALAAFHADLARDGGEHAADDGGVIVA